MAGRVTETAPAVRARPGAGRSRHEVGGDGGAEGHGPGPQSRRARPGASRTASPSGEDGRIAHQKWSITATGDQRDLGLRGPGQGEAAARPTTPIVSGVPAPWTTRRTVGTGGAPPPGAPGPGIDEAHRPRQRRCRTTTAPVATQRHGQDGEPGEAGRAPAGGA